MAPAFRFVSLRNWSPVNVYARLKCRQHVVAVESPRTMAVWQLLPGRNIVNLIAAFAYDGHKPFMSIYCLQIVNDDFCLSYVE